MAVVALAIALVCCALPEAPYVKAEKDRKPARLAPGRPEIEEHHFAAIVGELDGRPGGIFKSEVGRDLAACGRCNGAVLATAGCQTGEKNER